MNWTERVNSDPHLLCNNNKNTQVGRYLSPLLKSDQGQMIKKKNNNICTALFNKVMKYRITGYRSPVCETPCVCFCVCLGQTDAMAFEGLSPAPLDLS